MNSKKGSVTEEEQGETRVTEVRLGRDRMA